MTIRASTPPPTQKVNPKLNPDDNYNKHHSEIIFSGKPNLNHDPLTLSDLRAAVKKMREAEIKPDLNGDINFYVGPDGRWHPFDEPYSSLLGKP